MRRLRVITALLMPLACTFNLDRGLSPGQISGTLVFTGSAGGFTPAVGAHVALENSTLDTIADASGRFSLQGLPPGTYSLTITAATAGGAFDSGLRLRDITLQPSSGGANGLDLGTLQIGAFGGISGSVTLGGQPATGATVVLSGITQAAVSATGGFTFQNLVPGTYDLVVYSPSEAGAVIVPKSNVSVTPRVQTPVGAVTLDNAVNAALGSVAGDVVESTLDTTSAVQIDLSAPGVPASTLPSIVTQSTQGLYIEASLPPAIYTVTAQASGFAPVSVPFVVVGGGTTQVPTITLARLAQLPDGGTESDPALTDQLCTWMSGCGALAPFTSTSQCETSYGGSLMALQGSAGCSNVADALVDLMSCLTISPCEALLEGNACGIAQAQFDSTAQADATCAGLAGSLLPPVPDAGPIDAGPVDAGPLDAGPIDAGPVDAGPVDAGPVDAGPIDAGTVDSGPVDSGPIDAGPIDSGPDLNYVQWPAPSDAPLEAQYVVSTNGTIGTDTATNLVWERFALANPCGIDGGGCTWSAAQTYCASLNDVALGGYTSGWRLPTTVELLSLVNYNLPTAPYVDGTPFPDLGANTFWSSTPAAVSPGSAWGVDFDTGSPTIVTTTQESAVQCVNSPPVVDGGVTPPTGDAGTCGLKGNPCCYANACGPDLVCTGGQCLVDVNYVQWTPPTDTPLESQYTVSTEGTVATDTGTGFVWQRAVEAQPCSSDTAGAGLCSWSEAQSYCAGLNGAALGGYASGWRLPSVVELMTLVSYLEPSPPLIDTSPFPNTPATQFWTATPSALQSGDAWIVDFSSGSMNQASTTATYAVQCVNYPAPAVTQTPTCGAANQTCCYANACGPNLACTGTVCAPDVQYEQWAPPPDAPDGGAYTVSTDNNAVTDSATKLVWSRESSGSACPDGQNVCSWSNAESYCASLDVLKPGGVSSGWRLPSEVELLSIVDYGLDGGVFVDSTAFPNVTAAAYWSSTPTTMETSTAWTVDFSVGSPNMSAMSDAVAVICVSSN